MLPEWDLPSSDDAPDVVVEGEFSCPECKFSAGLGPETSTSMSMIGKCWCGTVYEIIPVS